MLVVLISGVRKLVAGKTESLGIFVGTESEGNRPTVVELGTKRSITRQKLVTSPWSHVVYCVDIVVG